MSPAELVSAGAAVGFAVGLTGMGGGALMAPLLIQLFGMDPLTAVGSDLVTSLLMKPVGAAVHWRRGTVEPGLVRLLCTTSVPAAFVSAVGVHLLGTPPGWVKGLIGAALLVACGAMLLRSLLERHARTEPLDPLRIRRGPTLLIGGIGGVCVGLTSVGAGSLMMVLLMATYPALRGARLVGTDLLQAIPLVAAAALGHALTGGVQFGVAAGLLVGAIPATYLGARLSARASFSWLQPVLFAVLFASGLRMVGVPLVWALGATVLATAALLLRARVRARELASAVADATAELE